MWSVNKSGAREGGSAVNVCTYTGKQPNNSPCGAVVEGGDAVLSPPGAGGALG